MEKIINILDESKNNRNTKIFCGDKSCSYSDIYEKAKIQKELILEFGKSKAVIMFMENSIEFIETFFAIHMANKVPVMLSVMENEKTVQKTVCTMKSSLIITDSKHRPLVFRALKCIDFSCYVLNVDVMKISVCGIPTVLLVGDDEELDDVAAIIKTSGTTNLSKLVMLTHKGIIQNIKAHISSVQLDKDDRTLIVLPMCFGYCFSSQLMAHVFLGAQIVISNNIFIPQDFLSKIYEYGITNTTIVPSMLFVMNKYLKWDDKRIKSLKKIIFGGMMCNLNSLNDLNRKANKVTIIQTYGQTEHSPRITTKVYDKQGITDLSNVGKPINGVQLKINSENGEICVKSDQIMKGYYDQIEATNEVIVDGWLHTGDKGYLDCSGDLHIQGRIKNIIIRNGINISVEAVEEVIRMAEEVKEVLVFSEKNEVDGENIVAKIVLSDFENLENVKSKIIENCRENLAVYMYPNRLEFVKELEHTINGKVKRYGN